LSAQLVIALFTGPSSVSAQVQQLADCTFRPTVALPAFSPEEIEAVQRWVSDSA
jgi:hypothetical protein